MAAEIGVTHHAIESALRRHGLDRVAHVAARHAAGERAAQVAARLGYDRIGLYLRERRAAGWTWRAMAAESGSPSHGCAARPPGTRGAERPARPDTEGPQPEDRQPEDRGPMQCGVPGPITARQRPRRVQAMAPLLSYGRVVAAWADASAPHP